VIDDIDILHEGAEGVEVVAVDLVELDVIGDIVPIAADEVVIAHHAIALFEEGIGEVATEEASNTGDKDGVVRHDRFEGWKCAAYSPLGTATYVPVQAGTTLQ
jgi:hypothetical protein